MRQTKRSILRGLQSRGVRWILLGATLLLPSATPALASASSLDCSGATIYSLQRPSSGPSAVYALQAATVGSSSVTGSLVTTLPSGSYANALGISVDGSKLYAVQQSGNSGSAEIWSYDTSTGKWSSYTGSGGTPSSIVAGAVDPVNGIFYYAQYSGATGTLYGFDTTTNQPISGAIGTFSLPNGGNGDNGDITFDQNGNMYVLASGGTRGIGVIKGPIPSTGSNATLNDTVISAVTDSQAYNGIAFDSSGRLYIEDYGTSSYITGVDPNNGAVLAGPTVIGSPAQGADIDLASCSHIPTLQAGTDVVARVNSADQFTVSVTGGTITSGNTATTTGSGTGAQPQTAGPVIGTAGTDYTVSETAAAGTLADYHVQYSCVDTSNGNSTVASGTGSSFTLMYPTAPSGGSPPSVVCDFTTEPQADVKVSDVVSGSPVHAGGQVTYALTVGNSGPDGATGVTLSDVLPSDFSVVSASPSQGSCSTVSGVSCQLGSLASGSSATVQVVAELTGSAASGSTLSDGVSVSADQFDPVLPNNSASAPVVVAPSADVGVTDVVSGSPVRPGGQVTYALTVGDSGPDGATGVTLSDALPTGLSLVSATPSQGSCSTSGGVSCALGTIALGSSTTVQVVAELTGSVASGSSLSDAVSVSADQFDPVLSNNSASSPVVVAPSADVGVSDVVSGSPVRPGGEVTYALTVGDSGPDGATGVALSDVLPSGLSVVSATPSQGSCSTSGGVSCALGTIALGSSATVQVVAKLTGSVASGSSLSDGVSVSADQFDPVLSNNSASAPVVVAPSADVGVTDVVSGSPVRPGGQVTYTLTVGDSGPDTATGVTLSDALPTGLSVVSATPSQGSCSTSGGISCPLGTLAHGSSATVEVVAALTGSATPGSSLADGVSVSADQFDPVLSNNSASAPVLVEGAASADLGVSDVVSGSPVRPGGQVTYTLTVGDSGPDTATGVTLSDTLPAGFSVVSASASQGSCSSGSTVSCQLGSLAKGSSASITVVAAVGSSVQPGTGFDDAVSVSADQFDPVLSNNSASAPVVVEAAPSADLGVSDVVSGSPVRAGGQVTYTLTVGDSGPDDATGVTLADALPTGLSVVSATPSQGSCSTSGGISCALGTIAQGSSATVEVVAQLTGTVASGSTLSDGVTVWATQPDPVMSNNTASAPVSVAAAQSAGTTDLSVNVHPNSRHARPGGQVSYTVTVVNHGPTAVPGAALTTSTAGGLEVRSASTTGGSCTMSVTLSCALGPLAVGQTATITVDGVARKPGSAVLTARVAISCSAGMSCPSDTDPSDDASSAQIPVRQRIRLSETVNHHSVRTGHMVTFGLKVSDPGGLSLRNVRVCEQLPLGLAFVAASQHAHLHDGRLCWRIGTLHAGRSRTIHVLVRALTGSSVRRAGRATATGQYVISTHALRTVRVLPAALPGAAQVTG